MSAHPTALAGVAATDPASHAVRPPGTDRTGWVVVGLRRRHVETMATAAITSAALHRSSTDHRCETMVVPLDAITTPATG